MSRTMPGLLAGCLLVLLGCVVAAAGDRAGEGGPGGKAKRLLYVVQHRDAKQLADALARHFRGEAEVQALPDLPGNCLLIRAAPAAFDEVVKALAQLDRRPRAVSVELLIAEVPAGKGEGGKPAPAAEELDAQRFSGPADVVLARVESLRKQGLLGSLRRIQLAAVEGQPASVRVGETSPYVTALTGRAGGPVQRSLTYRNTGTVAEVTARVSPDQVIALDLKLEDARPRVREDGAVIGKDENGAVVRATEFVQSSLKGTLNIRSGRALAAQGVTTTGPSGQARTLVIVAARVIGAEAAAGK